MIVKAYKRPTSPKSNSACFFVEVIEECTIFNKCITHQVQVIDYDNSAYCILDRFIFKSLQEELSCALLKLVIAMKDWTCYRSFYVGVIVLLKKNLLLSRAFSTVCTPFLTKVVRKYVFTYQMISSCSHNVILTSEVKLKDTSSLSMVIIIWIVRESVFSRLLNCLRIVLKHFFRDVSVVFSNIIIYSHYSPLNEY